MSTSPPSASMLVFQHRVERIVSMLMLLDPSGEVKAALLEARRLRTAIGSWAAIPPSIEAREQMKATLTDLETRALDLGTQLPSGIPSSAPAGYSMAPDSSTRGKRSQSIAPGITLTRPQRIDWRPFALVDGVAAKILRRDTEVGSYSALVKMAPGTSLPRHRHAAPEQIYLLEGFAILADIETRAGDHLFAEPGSVHEELASPEGCTFLLMASEHDEMLAAGDERDTLRPGA
jgi:quercetin dioxygenase-like cupin family protein